MLADVLRRHVAEDAPGAVVAVFHNGQWSCAARGLASLEHRRPITPDTVFDIASVSKQMTSAVAVALSHSGEFDLDTVVTVAASDDGTPRLSITGGPAWGVLPGYQVGGSEIIPLSDGGQVVRDADGGLTLSIWEVAVALEPVAEPDV